MVDEIEPPPIGSVYGAYQPHQFTEKGRDGGGGTIYHQVPTPQATKGIGKHKILHLKPSHSAQQMSQFNVQQAGPASTTPSSQQQHQLQQRAPPTTLPLQVFDQANVMVNMQQQHDSKEHAKKGWAETPRPYYYSSTDNLVWLYQCGFFVQEALETVASDCRWWRTKTGLI